jgi:hypothetical protein
MNKNIRIKNRSSGMVAYTIPELGDARNIRREFSPKEVKTISAKELEALTFVAGGKTLLEDYLQILDDEGFEITNITPEPEYNMNEEDIINLIQNGSYDSFLDALDFAPEGVIDLIKHYAVSLPCNDSSKREALRTKLGYNIEAALKIKREAETEDTVVTNTSVKQRRVAVPVTAQEEASTTHRPKYNVVG